LPPLPHDIAENRAFRNLFEIWLAGDHYKWRAMRANGVPEHFCTGSAPPLEKFMAWARTVPYTLRNPLYHWTHLELKRYFDIDQLLDETSAAGSGSERKGCWPPRSCGPTAFSGSSGSWRCAPPMIPPMISRLTGRSPPPGWTRGFIRLPSG